LRSSKGGCGFTKNAQEFEFGDERPKETRIVNVAAAIANAVYHAFDKLMALMALD
jgi:hypothetical protein